MSSSVGRNSLIMASGTAASRVTGQIRTILLAWALGTTGYAANAYQAVDDSAGHLHTGFRRHLQRGACAADRAHAEIEGRRNQAQQAHHPCHHLVVGCDAAHGRCHAVVDQTVCQRQRRNHGPRHLLHLVVHAPDLLLRPVYGDRADSRGEGPFRHVCVELGRREHHQLHRFRRVHRDVRQGHGTSAGLLDADEKSR